MSVFRLTRRRPATWPSDGGGLSVAAELEGASSMATTFSGGTSAITLCTWLKTNPPPGIKISSRRRTCSRTCWGVAPGSTICVSQPPPQNVTSRPNSRFSRSGSM